MGTLIRITFSYTELHREVTEIQRVKKSGLCGTLWILSDSLCKFLN